MKQRKVYTPLRLSTNGGILTTSNKAQGTGFGEVWYSQDAITNILSFSEMEDKFRITYNNDKEKVFIVHLPNKQVKFKCSNNGLYYCKANYKIENDKVINQEKPKQNKNVKKVTFAQTLENNLLHYTDRQIQRAKTARELYHSIGTPSVRDFKNIIRMNGIKNNPVTIEDINISEKIYEPDIGMLKSKSMKNNSLQFSVL